MTSKLRCRYRVWEKGRWIGDYQCNYPAKETRSLRVYGVKGIPEHNEDLPVCGVHARAVDRNPDSWSSSAYTWDENPFHAKVEEFVRSGIR